MSRFQDINMRNLLLTIIFGVVSAMSCIAGDAPSFHKVKAESGDGIFSLLRKYMLVDYNCNIKKFCELNELKLADFLIVGKEYKLPVYIYSYNGQSIRSTINDDNWDQAIRIKEYNESLQSKGLRQSSYLDSKMLWVPFHELNCNPVDLNSLTHEPTAAVKPKNTTKPNTIKTLQFPIFGDKYKNVDIQGDELKGKVFYIVAGHGGPDPGAICTECPKPLCEDEYAYDVALRLTRNLIQHGATAHMIIRDKNDGIRDDEHLPCDKDEVCIDTRIPIRQKIRLQQRATAINNLYNMYKKKGVKEQYAVMIHVDSRNKNHRQDVFFYYYKKSKSSKVLAENLKKTFKAKYDKYQKNRGYKGYVQDRGLYMVANTLPTAVYIELANIRNKKDQRRIVDKDNRQALANWLFEGLTDIRI